MPQNNGNNVSTDSKRRMKTAALDIENEGKLVRIFDALTTSDPNIKRTREMFVETCSTIICIFYSCEYIIINLLRISCFHICILSLYNIILPLHFILLHVYHKFKPTSYNVITFGLSSHSPSEHLRASSLLIFCIIHLVT